MKRLLIGPCVIGPLVLSAALCGCGDDNTGGDQGGAADLAMHPPDQARASDLATGANDLATGANDLATGANDLATGANDLATGASDLATGANDLAAADLAGFACTANSFLSCSGTSAVYCNATGDGTVSLDCGGTCKGPNDCGLCTPGTPSCANGVLTPCTKQGGLGAPLKCVTLGSNGGVCASATACEECTGAHVCGDGTSYNTVKESTYICVNGVVGNGINCAFGCDAVGGQCHDLVPASEGAQHLGANDTFTCTGKQIGTGDLAANLGDTITINTTVPAVSVNGIVVQQLGTWGAPYQPTGSATMARVLHLKSLTMATRTRLIVKGTSALVLLVDGDVTISGAQGNVTNIIANGSSNNTFGAGAPSSSGGGSIPSALTGGGGGAGHGTTGGNGGDGDAAANTFGKGGAAYNGTPVVEAGASGTAPVAAMGASKGGAGGGGMQITACGTVTVSTFVVWNASGGGGLGGSAALGLGAGGGAGGGGSGGTILIEANKLDLTGSFASNGGGGGEGGAGQNNPGGDGADWNATGFVTAPAGGGKSNGLGGAGGAGGAANLAPVQGGSVGANLGGGGGGGAVGRLFLNDSPLMPLGTAADSSPAAKASRVCVTAGGVAPNGCVYP